MSTVKVVLEKLQEHIRDLGNVALLLDEVMLMAERFELPGLAKRCGEAIALLGVAPAPFLPDDPLEAKGGEARD